MSTRTDVLLWAQRIIALSGSPPHQLLEIKADAGIEDAQDAFHKIARIAHPDLHRTGLTAEELEMVTLAYSRIAGAYQDFRSQRMQTTRIRTIKDVATPIPGISAARPVRPPPTAGSTPTSGVPNLAGSSPSGTNVASGSMNSKALIYYRKAELALRRGDLKNALMQMKMAIAGDPQSPFLRNALLEIELELAKG